VSSIQKPGRFLRLPMVEAKTGLKRTAIREAEARGEFPQSFLLSDGGRAKAWSEAEIDAWQEARIKARDDMRASQPAPASNPPQQKPPARGARKAVARPAPA
jgi:predicted DNA-binding transcriptional regulator AlpA